MSKKKRERLTPSDLQGITMVQSNHVTQARYNYSIYQQRVLAYVMYVNQPYIDHIKRGITTVEQLDMFSGRLPSDVYGLDIPLHIIGPPSQYKEIRAEIANMATIQVRVMTENKGMMKIAGLFSSVEIPVEEGRRHNNARVEMRKDVMQALMNIIRKEDKAQQFTIYQLHVCFAAKFKYTGKMYMILCSYRERGIFTPTVEELRDLLQIPDHMYPNFSDFKRFVLDRIAKELQEIGDIFYDTGDVDFITRGLKNKVTRLRFRLQYPATEKTFARELNAFCSQMFNIFGCNKTHLARVVPLMDQKTNWHNVDQAIARAIHRCQTGEIKYPAAFAITCVLEVLELPFTQV